MPRQNRKADDKAKVPVAAAPAPPPQTMVVPQPAVMPVPVAAHVPMPTRVVDIESFMRVRDSAIGRLSTVMDLIRSFTVDYIRQTNLLMGEPTAETGQADLLNSFENAAAQLLIPMPEVAAPVEEKKERKKRTHDPNAPKRPLTPYFLYMQNARSVIAEDLGENCPKGAVQDEGQRRWANMKPNERKNWNGAYQYNLRLYNARMHSYRAGNVMAKNMSDDEARQYADELNLAPPEGFQDVINQEPVDEQQAMSEQIRQLQDDDDEEPQLPVEEDDSGSLRKPSRKRKTATPTVDSAEHAKAAPASPDKKRRRASGKAVEDREEPKKSGRKKTKSS
ncbi:hypothetical protein CP533_2975 [Ophiocordyceps camponoti-saundersi (nom. inval.)]|nr:hypothetical protein CP533_2975 [Ophiocordyceps camponoti-saundersi (nom. inval.)]